MYVTISPTSTLTAFFLWKYSAVFNPSTRFLTFTSGILSSTFIVLTSVEFLTLRSILVINFLNDKSKYFPLNNTGS